MGLAMGNCILLLLFLGVALHAQAIDPALPKVVQKDGRFALFVDGSPFLMLGAQVNNSSAWPAMLPKVWPAMEAMHVNTVEIPVYWEQFEPIEGQFDSSVVDTILAQAREHKLHLVLLWFGTWKNGSGHYTPEWMKLATERFPHMLDAKGQALDSLSPCSDATLEADKRAFSMLMRHLKEADAQHTVLMVQVENESGTWGSVRDYSSAAEKLFKGPVPNELLSAMHRQTGTWQQVFGDDAEEFFHAWSVAHFAGQVAAAGKAVYALPMYANAALRDPLKQSRPPSYESGGPTDNVIPIWKAAARAIDILAPDIYMSDSAQYLKVLELYHRPDNAMFVPETGNTPAYARYFFAVLGHEGIGFSPFGTDYTGTMHESAGTKPATADRFAPIAMNYELVAPMQREIARLNFEGKLQAVVEEKGKPTETLSFGAWNATISYGLPQFGFGKAPAGNPEPVGRVLVAQLGSNEFLVSGFFCRVDFSLGDHASGKKRQFLKVEEGAYEHGAFVPIRVWNGDQTDYGINFGGSPQVLRVRLATY